MPSPAPRIEKPAAAAPSGATIAFPAAHLVEDLRPKSGATGARPFPKGVIIAVAAVVLLAVAIGVGLKMRSSADVVATPAVGAPTAVSLNIAPWANIDAVTNKTDQKLVEVGKKATPCVLMLPPGDYHVRASNPNFPAAFEFDVTVAAGSAGAGVQEVRRVMPGFQPEAEIDRIILNQ
jgi:hypothetical protein